MRQRDFIPAFLATFQARLERPTESLPSVRCLSGKTWRTLARQCTDEVAQGSRTRFPLQETRRELERLGVLIDLQPSSVGDRPPADSLLAFTRTKSDADSITPEEILLALEPSGVVVYFAALAHHRLTTQLPAAYHVALLHHEPKKARPLPSTPPSSPAAPRSMSLGQPLLRHRGVDFYRTRLANRLASDVQMAYRGRHAIHRVVSLEQALILSLHRPGHCGGPEVVEEAWEEAMDRLDQSRLAELLDATEDHDLMRRAGWLLQRLSATLEPSLATTLGAARARAHLAGGRDVTPMFPGFQHRAIDPYWWVEVL